MRHRRFFGCTLAVGLAISAAAQAAVPCGAGNFQSWLDDFKTEAASKGISHVLVSWPEIERYRSPGNYGLDDFVQPEVFRSLVAAGVLVEVVREPDMPDAGEQLFRVAAPR